MVESTVRRREGTAVRVQLLVTLYSALSTSIGSIFAARRAGAYAAASAAIRTAMAAPASVTGSVVWTSNSCVSARRASHRVASSPVMSPMPTGSIVCRNVSVTSDRGVAPIAIRMPISRVRPATR